MKIYISSDHQGYKLKEYLKDKLTNLDHIIIDWGPQNYDKDDDYPQQTEKVIKQIAENPEEKAILICKNGVGVTIFANRFKNVRAGLSWNPKHAKSHKVDDHTNILTLPAGYIKPKEGLKIVKTWINTEFSNEERHNRRINQIENLSK